MDAYERGLDGKQAAWATRKYKFCSIGCDETTHLLDMLWAHDAALFDVKKETPQNGVLLYAKKLHKKE